jgi:hypothetical protein
MSAIGKVFGYPVKVLRPPKVLLFDEESRDVLFVKAKRDGLVFHTDRGDYLAYGTDPWNRVILGGNARVPITLYLMGDSRPIVLGKKTVKELKALLQELETNGAKDDTKIGVLEHLAADPEILQAAIKSKIATRFLKGGFDWKVLMMILLGLIAVAAVVVPR